MRGLEKNRMGRGQTDTHTRTCRLLDQLGPEGRVGENNRPGLTWPCPTHNGLDTTRNYPNIFKYCPILPDNAPILPDIG